MPITAEEVRDCFNNSFLANFFTEFESTQGQEYLLALSQYVIDCGNGRYIYENCPAIFCCWASHYIAWLLATWAGGEIADDGSVTTPDIAASSPQLYLKKKTIGGKTCEWDIVDVNNLTNDCSTCPTDVVAEWESKWRELMDCCNAANTKPFIVGGSFLPEHKSCSACCGADGWTYY